MALRDETCKRPEIGQPPLSRDEAAALAREVPTWAVKGEGVEKEFAFRDFREAIGSVNEVADIADAQDHHPDILISYNKVRLTFSTHKIGGLSRNDFIMAAKIDQLTKKSQ
jgi:4a-hydroxytetrahydrobiopterin dehydratase